MVGYWDRWIFRWICGPAALGVQDLKTGRGENGPGSAARARDELQVSHWGHGGVAAGLFAGETGVDWLVE